MQDHELETTLGELVMSLPVGFSLTLGMVRTDGAFVAHAAIHSQDPRGSMVFFEESDSASGAVFALRERLKKIDGVG